MRPALPALPRPPGLRVGDRLGRVVRASHSRQARAARAYSAPGQAALRLFHVQPAGGWYAQPARTHRAGAPGRTCQLRAGAFVK